MLAASGALGFFFAATLTAEALCDDVLVEPDDNSEHDRKLHHEDEDHQPQEQAQSRLNQRDYLFTDGLAAGLLRLSVVDVGPEVEGSRDFGACGVGVANSRALVFFFEVSKHFRQEAGEVRRVVEHCGCYLLALLRLVGTIFEIQNQFLFFVNHRLGSGLGGRLGSGLGDRLGSGLGDRLGSGLDNVLKFSSTKGVSAGTV